jgi:hypothetical protein
MPWQVSVWRKAGRENWMVETEEDVADKLHGVERMCEVLCSRLVSQW